jgi:hypothetical protein
LVQELEIGLQVTGRITFSLRAFARRHICPGVKDTLLAPYVMNIGVMCDV